MAIDVTEVGSVWILKDMKFTTYDEGEKLTHDGSYGIYTSYAAAQRASKQLEETYPDLPRGNWVIHDEALYDA